jgi:hypothetical protein
MIGSFFRNLQSNTQEIALLIRPSMLLCTNTVGAFGTNAGFASGLIR